MYLKILLQNKYIYKIGSSAILIINLIKNILNIYDDNMYKLMEANMKLQVLVSCMHQQDYSLLEKMNIQTDAIIINQCDINKFEDIKYRNNLVKFISLNERGVGKSRNNALLRADSDICLFADEDVSYVDGYEDIIIKAFKKNPDADIILFNLESTNKQRPIYQITKEKRVRKYNFLKYGTVRIAAKVSSLRKANVHFSLLFGGGTKYGSGEDSQFLKDCISRGLKIYASPKKIGYVSQDSSCWFEGYNEKYFHDKGALYYCISNKYSKLLCLQFLLRKRKKVCENIDIIRAYKLMVSGIKDFK